MASGINMTPYELIEKKLHNSKSLDDLTAVLESLLNDGYSIWEDGRLYSIRQLVSRINGLRIVIYANEHPPPHFHVKGGEIDASFSILECQQLEGNVGRRELSLIKWWHKKSKSKLITIWNSTRPTDCTVGPIK